MLREDRIGAQTLVILLQRSKGGHIAIFAEYDFAKGIVTALIAGFASAGINFALYHAAQDTPRRAHWRELRGHDPACMLEGIDLNADGYVLSLREGGLPILQVHPQGATPYRVELPDAAYSLHVQDTLEFSSPVIRLRYEALNRPAQIRQLDLISGQQQVLKETPVEGPFDADTYESRRLWATAADGTRIPISLVARRAVLAA